jgi:hypothetical protein
MTTTTQTTPHFTVRSGSSARALFIAALCAFIVTSFLIDLQRGASSPDASTQVEQRT